MTFSDVAVSNIFLACIALFNVVILAMVYQMYKNK
jgi:high-affinity nickel permease